MVDARSKIEEVTQGLLKAISANRNKHLCAGCSFPIPVYPGRYPKNCPSCGMALKLDGTSTPPRQPAW